MRILVDLDNTLSFMWNKTAKLANEKFGDNFDPTSLESVPGWNLENFSNAGTKIYDLWMEPGFFLDVPVFEGALDIIPRLAQNHEIQVVTSSWTTVLDDKRKWLEQYFPFLKWSNVTVTTKKYMVEGDVLVDDNSVDNLGPWKARWTDGVGIAVASGYNKEWPIRCKNWHEIGVLIHAVEKERGRVFDIDYMCGFITRLFRDGYTPENVMKLIG